MAEMVDRNIAADAQKDLRSLTIYIGKIDKAVETVEQVVEVVEEKRPDDSKLKEGLESFDRLAKQAVDEAKRAEDVVNKVKDMEEELEATLIKAVKGQAKK